MNRKSLKLILLIVGLIFAVAGLAILLLNMISIFTNKSSNSSNLIDSMIFPGVIIIPGVIPLIIVSLMHSKDVRETKPGVSGFLKFLAFFWIITGGLNTIALIVISIFFIK